MENQAVNGVLDLGFCNPPEGRLILPPGMESMTSNVELLEEEERVVKALNPLPPEKTWEGEWTFEKEHGFPSGRSVGPYMIVQIYKKKLSSTLEIVKETRDQQKWSTNVGRVVYLGSACFKGEQFKDWDKSDFPKIGDWITYKVNSGPTVNFRGIDIVVMFDDAMNMKLEDPEHVSRD